MDKVIYIIFLLFLCSCKKLHTDRNKLDCYHEFRTLYRLYLELMIDEKNFESINYSDLVTVALSSEYEKLIPSRWKETKELLDPWGSPYQFQLVENGVKVWSCGPNRIDDKCLVDDLVPEFDDGILILSDKR